MITPVGRLGGPSYLYRGAIIDATDASGLGTVKWFLMFDRHPCDGEMFASQEECARMVDNWLDRGQALASHVGP
ncbi:hypothetical protein [Roseomonas sp. BN140053]|uniref:hypothetical protein n=1 Tax=Roseomonas sp. BN140053 TaxID=3391898 RepID=UPI0039ED9C10